MAECKELIDIAKNEERSSENKADNMLVKPEETSHCNGHSNIEKESNVRNSQQRVPFYLREDILKLSVEERKERIVAYHIEMHKIISEARRKSIDFVPWGKPILLTNKEKCNGSLFKRKEEDVSEEMRTNEQLEDETTQEEIYVSHSGRQTKKKCYNENALMGSLLAKSFKSSSPVENKNKLRKALTNKEIMKRSSLFADKDEPKPYTDKIFDRLVSENRKRQQEEEEMYRFQQTLATVDDEKELNDCQNGNDDKSNNAAEDPSYEGQIKRRRIVPPNPLERKLYTTKKTGDKPQDREVQQKKRNNNQTPIVDLNDNVEKNQTTTKEKPSTSKERAHCPICEKAFDCNKLELHAATCGETDDNEPTIIHDEKSSITCAVCDKVFMVADEFHAHIDQCLKGHYLK